MRKFRVQYFEGALHFSEPVDFEAASYEEAIVHLGLGDLVQDNAAAADDLRAILWQLSPTLTKTLLWKDRKNAA